MKNIFLYPFLVVGFITCSTEEYILQPKISEEKGNDGICNIQEGYFEVVFGTSMTRAAVTGEDWRISDLKYILFESTGEFVKERHIFSPSDGFETWPLTAIKDTLPKGEYRAVFIGNAEKTLFPYRVGDGPVNYNEILYDYHFGYHSGRIVLPNSEFTDHTEYYMSNVLFSDSSPYPEILLQRIIAKLNIHRNAVDAQMALNMLVNNIVTQVGYRNIIQTQLQNILPGLLRDVLDLGLIGNLVYAVVGGLDSLINILLDGLLLPITNYLYDILIEELINQLGMVLAGNTGHSELLGFLGPLLNPWQTTEADGAIITIADFPKAIDFDLVVREYYPGEQQFLFKFADTGLYDNKNLLIKGFSGLYDVREINIVKQGLISGLLIEQIIESSWFLDGTFIHINQPVDLTNFTNRRFRSDYSLIDLGLKSYAVQEDGAHSLNLKISLADLPYLEDILRAIPLLSPLLDLLATVILAPLRLITIEIPLNLPLLGISNLELTCGWNDPVMY